VGNMTSSSLFLTKSRKRNYQKEREPNKMVVIKEGKREKQTMKNDFDKVQKKNNNNFTKNLFI
jgi:hypothetical protein